MDHGTDAERYRQRYRLGHRDNEKFEEMSENLVQALPRSDKIHQMREIIKKLKQGFGIQKTYQLRHSLGAGGFGLTGVVDQYDRQGNHEKVLCVKFKLDSSSTLAHERRMTRVS